jgi:acylphosphatase
MAEAPDDAERLRVHVHVTGRVQGVGFRATTSRHANQHGAAGWVRNLDDGRVEAVFEGPPDVVEAMVEFCHEGSRAARVDDVTVETEQPVGLSGFDVRR